MQRFYERVFIAGLLITPLGVGLGLMFCFGVLPVSPILVGLPWGIVVAPLALACLTLRWLPRRWTLRWPRFITPTQYFWNNGAVALLFVGAMAYGLWFWPAAPLKPSDGAYTDKAGKLYSRAEFDSFQRWEAVLSYFCLPFAVSSILGLPVSPLPRYRRGAADQPEVERDIVDKL